MTNLYDEFFIIQSEAGKKAMLKMRINKEETYGGQSYKFKIGKSIGKGGNGEVFEANIINSEV